MSGKRKNVKDPLGFGSETYQETSNGKTAYTDFFGNKKGSIEKHWLTGDRIVRDSAGNEVSRHSFGNPSHYQVVGKIENSKKKANIPNCYNGSGNFGSTGYKEPTAWDILGPLTIAFLPCFLVYWSVVALMGGKDNLSPNQKTVAISISVLLGPPLAIALLIVLLYIFQFLSSTPV